VIRVRKKPRLIKPRLIFFLLFLLSCPAWGFAGAAEEKLRMEVDSTSPLTVEFPQANIRVEGWNHNYVSINTLQPLKEEYKIEAHGNSVALTWVADQDGPEEEEPHESAAVEKRTPTGRNRPSGLFGHAHFVIKVPKELPLIIEAEELQIRDGCRVAAAKSKQAIFRNCAFLDGFVGEGSSILVQRAQIGRNCLLTYERVNIRDSQVKQLILRERPDLRQVYATIKRVKGEEMEIRADRPDKLTVLIYTSKLKRLTVNSEGGSGDVILWWTTIGELTEKSSLRVHPFIVW
jgi:hypothetical protein